MRSTLADRTVRCSIEELFDVVYDYLNPRESRSDTDAKWCLHPDVIGGGNLYGEATIYGCLFSDNW